MQARQSQQQFDHDQHLFQQQQSQLQLTQGYQAYHDTHHGYSNGKANNSGRLGSVSRQQQEESYQPKSFLSQNSSPKAPFSQTQNSLKSQSQLQGNYSSASASTLSTRRDQLSPSNALQESSMNLQQQYQRQQKQQQEQTYQAFQPLTNNFFNNHQESQQNNYQQQRQQSQQQFKAGYSLTNLQQQSQQDQKLQSPSGYQNDFQQGSEQGSIGGSYYKKNNMQFQQKQQQLQQQVSNKFIYPDENRHTSLDQMRNKENLQETYQKAYQNQPSNNRISGTSADSVSLNSYATSQSASNLQSFQKVNNSTTTKGIRPSPRDASNQGFQQPSAQNNNRQQLRASTSSSQIDSRVQRNSFTTNQLAQNMKSTGNSNINNTEQIRANSYSQMPEPTQIQENQEQYYNGVPSRGHMYSSNIVPSSPSMILSGMHQNMKRSDIIDVKQNSYLTQFKQNMHVSPKETFSGNRSKINQQNEQVQQDNTPLMETQKKEILLQQKTQLGATTQSQKQRKSDGDRKSISNKNYSIDQSNEPQRSTSQSQILKPKSTPDRREPPQKPQAQSSVFGSEKSPTQQMKTTEPRVYSEEYQEYKKLQEKLNYLESKIMSIKTNIDSTYSKEKEEQRIEVPSSSSKQKRETYQPSFQSQQRQSRESSQTGVKSAQQQASPSQESGSANSFTFFASQKRTSENVTANTRSNNTDSANSYSNKYARDQEGSLHRDKSSKGNSFSMEQTQQNTTKPLAKNNNGSNSSSNLLKNTTTSSSSAIMQSFSANGSNSQTSEEAILTNKSNPLSSFVTQVSKGSGIPLSPKTATDVSKRNKLEEKVSSSVHYDPNNIVNALSTSIPKTYLNKLQQSAQSKSTEGKQNINSSYSKKKEESDSFEGSNSITNQPSSTKNQGKNSLVISSTKPKSTSTSSLKNSNVITNLSQASSPQHKKASTIISPPSPPFMYYISQIVKSYLEPSNQSVFAGLAREHLIQTMQAINFARMLTPASQKVIDEKKVFMPTRRDGKKTIVFDLDETLIHCNENSNIPSDVVLPIKFPTGEVIEAGINVRPYCLEILQELSKIYEIVIFTASHSCYANVVLDYLDPKGQYISARLFRENCVTTDEGVYIKDLRVIQNRSLSDLVLVDNAAYSFGFQIDNGIPIIPFYDSKSDTELKHLMHFMKSIHNVRDLREVMRKFLKVGSYSDFSDPLELISSLFEELIQ